MTRYLQLWTQLARTTDGLRKSPETIGLQGDALMEREAAMKGMSYQVNWQSFFASSEFIWTNRLSKAEWTVALAFADALILHARTGRWPAAFTAPDPLGKGPLKVRFDGGRFRVWSVGKDGRDDRGLLNREVEVERGKISDDIAAAYPPVPPAPRPKTSPPGVGPD